jgi:2-dehydropantoate 2-reductase
MRECRERVRKIAVIGPGGVGGYFGARLAAAGIEVFFIGRGRHLEAMQYNGLRVESALGCLHLPAGCARASADEIGGVDAVIFAVKLGDTETAAQACHPLLAPKTAVFTFQNGVDSAERVGAILGAARVVPGVAYIASGVIEPGVIRHTGTMARLVFGERDGRASLRCQAMLRDCQLAGIEAGLSDHIDEALWRKFVMLAPFAGLTSLARKPIGPIRAHPDTRVLLEAAVKEVVAVAVAQGIELGADIVEETMATLDQVHEQMNSSMAQDLALGKPLELPWLSGAVVRLGREHGVSTPVHQFIQQALVLHQQGRQ